MSRVDLIIVIAASSIALLNFSLKVRLINMFAYKIFFFFVGMVIGSKLDSL